MHYEISFDIAAAIIFLVITILYYTKKKSPYRYNVVFGVLLIVCLVTSILDIVSALTIMNTTKIPIWLNYVINILYLAFQNTAAPLYAWYIVLLTNAGRRTSPKIIFLLLVPYAVVLLLILTTWKTGLIFFFDQNSIYTHAPLMATLYISVVYYFMLGAFFILKNSKSLAFEKQFALYSFLPVNGLGMAAQLIFPSYLLNPFCMSISMTLLLFSVQNADELLDPASGAFDEKAFGNTVEGDLLTKQDFWFVGIDLVNFEMIEKNIGVEQIDLILKKLVNYLNLVHKKAIVGRMEEHRFGIKLPSMTSQKIGELAEIMRKRLESPLDDIQKNESFKVKVICIECPREAATLEQIADILSYVKEQGTENAIFMAADIDQDARNRSFEIRRAIRTAMDEHKFEVYYQPIYSVKEQRIDSAEALIRLKDEKLGFISPEIFIPIAEKGGYILEIGNFVFESVCRFFQENRLNELGIEYIEVNLSVVECMQHDLAQRLFDITSKYRISPKYLNLEITETATAGSTEMLYHTMHRLTEDGFVFSMDDYGTGYSNIKAVHDLPFEYIKIDKSILWTSMENEKAYVVLKNTFSLAKALGKKIVMEGVETEEHIRRLLELECDYFQGYYYSKPIPGDQFIEYLKKNS